MSEPSFREAGESDLATLLQFIREYYAFDGHTFDEEQTPIALTKFLREPTFGRAWLILDHGTPVGYVVLCFGYSLEWLGRDAFVDEFYLRPEYRRRGWGRKTMDLLEDATRALDIRAFHLEVVQQNQDALRIYRQLGFKAHQSTFLSKRVARGPAQSSSQARKSAETSR